MLKESAVVMSYDAETGLAKVKCQSQSACGACSAREACGTASLSELNGKRGEHIFTLETITPLRTGQMVEIGLEEKSMLFSALPGIKPLNNDDALSARPLPAAYPFFAIAA